MSQIYTEKRRNVVGGQNTPKSAENISKSDMLHMSGAGAPQPMSASLREKFEPGFGADFSNIRISRGHIPEEMGVQAVAKGTDILVDSRAGMDVLGHELAHVVQQAQGRVEGGYPVVENAALEHEADVMGARVASGMNAELGGMSGMGGEMMSIAPMSGAEAPAQCKSKEEKKGKGSAPVADPRSLAKVTHKGDAAALGDKSLVEQYYDHDESGKRLAGPSKIAQDLTNAYRTSRANGEDRDDATAKFGNALGWRSDANRQAFISQRSGTAYDRVSSDITDYFDALDKNGTDWDKLYANSQSSRQVNEKFQSGGNFAISEDISKITSGALDIFSSYADDPLIQEQLKEQYELLNGAEGFGEDVNGSQMDWFMQSIMNKQFGSRFEDSKKKMINEGKNNMAVSKVNSFVTTGLHRFDTMLRSGALTEEEVPDHVREPLKQYRAFRNKISGVVGSDERVDDGSTVDPAPGNQYVTQADLPQSGADWEHTGSWKVMPSHGYNMAADRVDVMPGGSKEFGASAAAPQKKKGLFARLFGR